jgi:hypothetical protein
MPLIDQPIQLHAKQIIVPTGFLLLAYVASCESARKHPLIDRILANLLATLQQFDAGFTGRCGLLQGRLSILTT